MKKVIFFVLILIAGQYVLAEGISIQFPEKSTISVGIAPIIRDKDEMERYSLVNAAIFATKLKESYCIYRFAIQDVQSGKKDHAEFRTFIVNVVNDITLLYEHLDDLKLVYSEDFKKYRVAFYDTLDTFNPIVVRPFDYPITVEEPDVLVNGRIVKSTGYANSKDLDTAFDEAFKLALAEISKYQDMNIKSMNKNYDSSDTEINESVMELNSENIVTNVYFSEIELYFGFKNNLINYIAKIELMKDFGNMLPPMARPAKEGQIEETGEEEEWTEQPSSQPDTALPDSP
jgi:hypothetical protein